MGDIPRMKTALMLSALLALLAACGRETTPAPAADIRPVHAERVGLLAQYSSIRYSGEVRARYAPHLAFRVAGKVQTRLVEVGTHVNAGQVMATLDPQDYALVANAARAQQDVQRFSALRAQNCISQTELERHSTVAAAAKESQLRAEAQRQGNQQSYTRLTAPHRTLAW